LKEMASGNGPGRQRRCVMSTPIKKTPVLHGKDATKFVEKITRNEREPAPREEYERVMANCRKVKIQEK